MGFTIAEKIIKAHLVEGEMVKGSEIAIKIDTIISICNYSFWISNDILYG